MKLKTFPLMISKQFMKAHPRAGALTRFMSKILLNFGQVVVEDEGGSQFASRPGYVSEYATKIIMESGIKPKIHTIRDNYEYWARIADEVNAGRGILSLRQWTGSPYNFKCDGSKPKEFLQLPKMGIQKITIEKILDAHISEGTPLSIGFDYSIFIDGKVSKQVNILPQNDGLSDADFRGWFKKPIIKGAIIHFTDFRYGTNS